MAGTRLRGGSRSLARSGFTRHEKYNVGAAVRGKEELSPTACPAAGVSYSGGRPRGFQQHGRIVNQCRRHPAYG